MRLKPEAFNVSVVATIRSLTHDLGNVEASLDDHVLGERAEHCRVGRVGDVDDRNPVGADGVGELLVAVGI